MALNAGLTVTTYRVLHLGDALPTGSRVIDAPDPLAAVLALAGPVTVREAHSHMFEGRPALTLLTTTGWFTILHEVTPR